MPTVDLDIWGEGDDRGWGEVPGEREVFVAHGAEDVYAGHVEELASRRDEDPDADRLAGFSGRHIKSDDVWLETKRCYYSLEFFL